MHNLNRSSGIHYRGDSQNRVTPLYWGGGGGSCKKDLSLMVQIRATPILGSTQPEDAHGVFIFINGVFGLDRNPKP